MPEMQEHFPAVPWTARNPKTKSFWLADTPKMQAHFSAGA
jgi:hypothetical protein